MHWARGQRRLQGALLVSVWAGPASANETVSYRYDVLGRLVRTEHVDGPAANLQSTYSYDAAGNRQAVTSASSTSQGTPVVTNASFETPPLGNTFQYSPQNSGVTFNPWSGIAGNGSGWSFPPAPAGSQVAFLQSPSDGNAGRIDQPVSGLVPGRSYVVAFSAVKPPNHAQNSVSVSVGGTTLLTVAPPGVFQAYRSAAFVASSSSATITFAGAPSGVDSASGIDGVSVEEAGAVVPVPTVANASFESPDTQGSYAYGPSAPGVVFSSISGLAANGSAFAFPTTTDGAQVAFLQASPGGAYGSFAQTVDGLVAGHAYRVRFKAVARPGYDPNAVKVSVAGVSLFDQTPGAAFATYVTGYFTASSSSAQIVFAATPASADAASGIDAVSVEAQ